MTRGLWRAGIFFVLGVGLHAFVLEKGECAHSQIKKAEQTASSSCRVLIFPGAISGEEGGGSGFFISAGEVFRELRDLLQDVGIQTVILRLPADLGVASRGVALKERVHRLREKENTASSFPSELWIAHSQAGIDARYALKLDPSLRRGVRAILTLGTPHLGTELGAWAARAEVQKGWLSWGLRVFFRYDLESLSFLSDLSPDGMRAGQRKLLSYDEAKEIRFSYADLHCRQSGCSWPFRLLAGFAKMDQASGSFGDGLVSRKSQVFGEPIGEFALDHLEQLGGQTDADGRAQRLLFHQAVLNWAKDHCS